MNEQLFSVLQNNPQVRQAIEQGVAGLQGDPDVTPEAVDQMINMFEFVLENPKAYPQLRQQAIQSGQLDEEDLPPEYDEATVTIIVMTLKVLKQRMLERQGGAPQGDPVPQMPQGGQVPAFARGGLNQIAAAGRRGDTQLAHINPFEAQVLKSYGGSGTINPATGLPEFGFLRKAWKAVKRVAKVAAPIAAMFVAPYLAPYLGGSMLAAGAATGGLGAALTGGNVLQGAALGGLSGGLGGMAGDAANQALGLGLGTTGQAILGGGLVGGAVGQATGQGFAQGAAQGALGQYVGGQMGSTGAGGDFGRGLSAGGQQFGNMLTAGYDPKTAAQGGVLGGLATGMLNPTTPSNQGLKPSTAVVDGLSASSMPSTMDYGLTSGQATLPTGYDVGDMGSGVTAPASALSLPAAGSAGNFGLNAGTALKGLALSSMLQKQGAPQQVQEAVSSMSPAQQEYFNRPSVMWDWGKLQTDASNSGLGLSDYMAQNWNTVSSGAYNQPEVPKLARGGALSQIAYAVGGSGSGRADTIDAKLSDGEYVMDAETVAMLGDGSGKEGALRLDKMRSELRAHKGKNLSRGQISPNAKSPLAYLKGAR